MLASGAILNGKHSLLARRFPFSCRGLKKRNRGIWVERSGLKALLIRSGGRKQVIANALTKKPLLTRHYIAPRNPETSHVGDNFDRRRPSRRDRLLSHSRNSVRRQTRAAPTSSTGQRFCRRDIGWLAGGCTQRKALLSSAGVCTAISRVSHPYSASWEGRVRATLYQQCNTDYRPAAAIDSDPIRSPREGWAIP